MIKEPPKTSPKKKVTFIYDIKNNPVFRKLFWDNEKPIIDSSKPLSKKYGE